MQSLKIEIVHYNRKKERIDISSQENEAYIKKIVTDTIKNLLIKGEYCE